MFSEKPPRLSYHIEQLGVVGGVLSWVTSLLEWFLGVTMIPFCVLFRIMILSAMAYAVLELLFSFVGTQIYRLIY